jgi:methionyl-tRNA formyltransferase
MGNAVKTYLLVSEKRWHDPLFQELKAAVPGNWFKHDSKDDFNIANLEKVKPDFIFIPHWSHIIPAEIYEHFECIVFHMTDLPYGRGGSPLQNLIVRGHQDTLISAIRVSKGIDTGNVYLKKSLTLTGTAQEIFERASGVIKQMIIEIIQNSPEPQPQQGKVIFFKRRTPEESNIAQLESIEKVYDYIRMLDADGYPKAFIETEHFRIEFSNAKMNSDNTLTAHVCIVSK